MNLRKNPTNSFVGVRQEQDKWVHARDVVTSGTDKDPYWEIPELAANEKKGQELSSYKIYALDKNGNKKEYDINEGIWQELNAGQVVDVRISNGSITEIVKIVSENPVEPAVAN